jgi:hypothetical protein
MNNQGKQIPPGLWAPLPIPAIKFLVRNGHRPASRILYAIVLHKGTPNAPIFPSYEALALYACVGENSIRGCLNTLQKYGFIKVTKMRSGKKEQNYYTILDKAYNLELNPKAKNSQPQEVMICNSCWDDIEPTKAEVYYSVDWEGRREKKFRHFGCTEDIGYGLLLPVTDFSRRNQLFQRAIMERSKIG